MDGHVPLRPVLSKFVDEVPILAPTGTGMGAHSGRNLRVAHVCPDLDIEAAGPTQSVLRLCESLALEDVHVSLHTNLTGRRPVGVALNTHPGWRGLGRFGFSLQLVRALAAASREADILHNHSLWSGPSTTSGLTATWGKASLITSPRGTLSPVALTHSAWKKRLFRPLQWPALSKASLLHATSRMELEDIRSQSLRQQVAIVPNGIDVPDDLERRNVRSRGSVSRLLYLGRLHPIKGIEMLLEGWRELQQFYPTWELVVAGGGAESYESRLRGMAHNLGLERVTFAGAVFGEAKNLLYQESDLFVLPTRSENFGMVVAEALACGLPVITTRGAPWEGLREHRCGWWIERSREELVSALDQAMRLSPNELLGMGLRGRQWMLDEFDWRVVARSMKSVYQWIRDGGERPRCVVTD